MSVPKVLKHGEHVNPHYAPATGQTQSWAGKSTDAERKDGEITGIVKRYAKRERASTTPVTMAWIKASLSQSIEYTGSPQNVRGLVLMGGLFGLVGCPVGIWIGIGMWKFGDWFAIVLGSSVTIATLFFAVYIVLWPTRLELFRPTDEPTIFDRAHRKVYRIFRETQPGFKGLFKPWPLRVCEYEWDLIDVEHTATVATTGSTVTRYHALVFIVKRSAADATIIDSFNIGNGMELGEQTVPAVWEHIRRFMEERGPHLPPGDKLAPAEPPQTLWQSLGAVGPIGPKYVHWWKDQLPFMILIHVLFPFFVPFFLLWGFFNWLSYKTATPVEWPQEVLDAVGAAQSVQQ